MARLLEHQSKRLLFDAGFKVPRSVIIENERDVQRAFEKIGSAGVLKAQGLTTGRAALGLIKFPNSLQELEGDTLELLGRTIGREKIESVLYEERLDIAGEYYAGITVDSSKGLPVLIFSAKGGSGIEDIIRNHPDTAFTYDIDIDISPKRFEIVELLKGCGISGRQLNALADCMIGLWQIALKYEARSLEINPLVVTKEQEIVVLDCHLTVDDYAIFRHPELNIEVPRELGHPPTGLERIAYQIERSDYRGTFYFIQLEQEFKKGQGFIGFHGAGGGGSIMGMDALQRYGYKPANFCDTSGNPPASKVYRAARIILSQKNIDAYFGTGSGVASQEQFISARGLVKAFYEENIEIPVVVRLGGNGEEKAKIIMEAGTVDLPVTVRCFGRDTPVNQCLEFLDGQIKGSRHGAKRERKAVTSNVDYSF